MKVLIEKHKIDEVVIESSPFIRTMMTAANLAKALEVSKFNVNYIYSELLTAHYF